MQRAVNRHIYKKILVYTLASFLVIFSALHPLNLAVAQNINSAIEKIEQALKQNPNDPEVNLALATAYFQKYQETGKIKDLDTAIQTVQNGISLESEFAPAHLVLYRLLTEKAIQQSNINLLNEINHEYQEVLRTFPDSESLKVIPHPNLIAGMLYYNLSHKEAGNNEQARYEEKAIIELQKAINAQPNNANNHQLLSIIYFDRDKNDLALLEAKEANRLAPNDAENYKLIGSIYGDNIHRSKDCWDADAITQGIKAFKDAIRLAPEDADTHMGLSDFYIHQGAYNLAVAESKIAVRLSASPQHHRKLGDALLFVGDYEQAFKEYNEVLKRNSSYVIAHADLAFAYFLQNKFEDAAKEYQKYTKLVKAPGAYAVSYYSIALRHLGKNAEAQQLLEKYVKNYHEGEWQLQLLNFNLGKLTDAELIGRARNKCQTSDALFLIGYKYLLAGDKYKAREYFQKTVDTQVFCSYRYINANARLKDLILH
ncbi:TPR repeat-containing protein [Calothrix sp. NIES-2100]|uniref:tetratricopeptide repeat protein n=1 Tax=Calothrix sp. NIES-2100 TaxID=1954172 RepID=UPI000B609004|nr:TPR repeat-containing protein [Calothrix sp. NIES-2100]